MKPELALVKQPGTEEAYLQQLDGTFWRWPKWWGTGTLWGRACTGWNEKKVEVLIATVQALGAPYDRTGSVVHVADAFAF